MVPLDSPQPDYKVPALDTIPDNELDQPVPGQPLVSSGFPNTISPPA